MDITGIEPVHYKQLVQECTIMPDQLTQQRVNTDMTAVPRVDNTNVAGSISACHSFYDTDAHVCTARTYTYAGIACYAQHEQRL